VREAFLVNYLEQGWPMAEIEPNAVPSQMYQAFAANDLPAFFKLLTGVLAAIPYHQYQGHTEGFYHAVVHTALTFSGHRIASEVATSTGRIDAVLETGTHFYIFEFKLTTAQEALMQIKANNYCAPYLHKGKTVTAIGAAFDANTRTLQEWASEVVGDV